MTLLHLTYNKTSNLPSGATLIIDDKVINVAGGLPLDLVDEIEAYYTHQHRKAYYDKQEG